MVLVLQAGNYWRISCCGFERGGGGNNNDNNVRQNVSKSKFTFSQTVFVEVGVPACSESDLAQTGMGDRALYNTSTQLHRVNPG